ncbi:MAG: TatD family hydrolase [Thermomicrobiales bacterium]
MSEAPPPIFDSHVHLDDPAFDADQPEVLDRGRAAGVQGFLNIAYRPDIWDQSVALRSSHPDVELAAGIHPQDARALVPAQSDTLAEQLLALRPLAIGEAGFDFARPGPGFEEQQHAFQWQIELAISSGLPLIIHQRDAGAQLTRELDRWPQLQSVILHSFDGDEFLAEWARARGFFVGIGGLACRKGSHILRKALSLIPAERLLLETDSPYLAPPGVKSRRNEPANLPLVAAALAPLWDLTPDQLRRQTTANAAGLFNLDLPARSERRTA